MLISPSLIKATLAGRARLGQLIVLMSPQVGSFESYSLYLVVGAVNEHISRQLVYGLLLPAVWRQLEKIKQTMPHLMKESEHRRAADRFFNILPVTRQRHETLSHVLHQLVTDVD